MTKAIVGDIKVKEVADQKKREEEERNAAKWANARVPSVGLPLTPENPIIVASREAKKRTFGGW